MEKKANELNNKEIQELIDKFYDEEIALKKLLKQVKEAKKRGETLNILNPITQKPKSRKTKKQGILPDKNTNEDSEPKL